MARRNRSFATEQLPVEDIVVVGTVSPQHMYGLESTVLMALHGPCALVAEHPLHPDEVIAVLSQVSGRRVLITAPVHLRALVESTRSMPALDRVVSATAPLTSTLAALRIGVGDARVRGVWLYGDRHGCNAPHGRRPAMDHDA